MANKLTKRTPFTTTPNALIQDNSISDRARFLYVYMNSMPDDWSFFMGPLASALGMHLDTLRKYINELESAGWLKNHGQIVSKGGSFGSNNYELCFSPCPKKTDTVKPVSEKNRHGKTPTQTKETSKQKKHNTKETNIQRGVNEQANDEIKPPLPEPPELEYTFEDFWEVYGKDIREQKCRLQFGGLTYDEIDEIKNHLPRYVASTPEKRYRMNPSTYLKDKCWNDEIISKDKPKANLKPVYQAPRESSISKSIPELQAMMAERRAKYGS